MEKLTWLNTEETLVTLRGGGGGGVLPFFLDMLQVNREHSVVSITLGHMLINGLRHGRTGWKSARDRAHDDMT